MRLSACLLLAALAACGAPEPQVDPGASRIGVVVLHGKWNNPYGATLRFTRTLIRDGYLTDSPEMPWSERRSYDTGVDGAMKEIDAAVARLKSRGAQKIFVAGHSLGAAAAVRYATLRRVDGLIALAPGHFPEGQRFQERTGDSLQKAKALPPGTFDYFNDPNNGRTKPMRMSARIYLDYFDPSGPMNFHRNVAAVRPGTPVLWVVGDGENPNVKKGDQVLFEALPRSPPPKFVEVAASHIETPDAAGTVCAKWISDIARGAAITERSSP